MPAKGSVVRCAKAADTVEQQTNALQQQVGALARQVAPEYEKGEDKADNARDERQPGVDYVHYSVSFRRER